jgi:hypothetical protein
MSFLTPTILMQATARSPAVEAAEDALDKLARDKAPRLKQVRVQALLVAFCSFLGVRGPCVLPREFAGCSLLVSHGC